MQRSAACRSHNERDKKLFPFSAAFEPCHAWTAQSYPCFLLGQDVAEPVKRFLSAIRVRSECSVWWLAVPPVCASALRTSSGSSLEMDSCEQCERPRAIAPCWDCLSPGEVLDQTGGPAGVASPALVTIVQRAGCSRSARASRCPRGKAGALGCRSSSCSCSRWKVC